MKKSIFLSKKIIIVITITIFLNYPILFYAMEKTEIEFYTIDIQSGDTLYKITYPINDTPLVHNFLSKHTYNVEGIYKINESYVANYFIHNITNEPKEKHKVAFRNLKKGLTRYLLKNKKNYFSTTSSSESILEDVFDQIKRDALMRPYPFNI